MKQLSEADNGSEVQVAVGETIELRLSGVAGSGFIWILRTPVGPNVALAKELPDESKSAPGAQRVQRWRGDVVAAGSVTLEADYARPWETKAPARSFRVKLRAV